MRFNLYIVLLMVVAAVSGCTSNGNNATVPNVDSKTKSAASPAFAANERLGRGINLGNALEAPMEGMWGVTLEEEFFSIIAEAGFDSVRIPIKWSAYAEEEPPYAISDAIFDRVDWAIEQAQANDLAVVINIHHYDELVADPDGHSERLLALWQQIAAHYADYPDTLYFELLNEPNGNLTPQRWGDLWPQVLATVRESNPTRPVIVGPGQWYNISTLSTLEIPDDPNLIVSFHYYNPFQFTHQGAEWVDGSSNWLGTTWTGTDQQQQSVRDDFDMAAGWAERQGVPLYMGEFGAYSRADMASRVQWTEFVTREAEARGFSWAYWEFGAGFGAYDRTLGQWNEPLINALMPQ